MNVRLARPQTDGFWVNEHDGRILIVPTKMKFHWSFEEREYRSLMLSSETGEVLSIGFPKFFNYGEEGQAEDHMRLVETALADPSAPVRVTAKFDGTLAIRSVIDGEVVLRTRGTVDGGDFAPHLHAVAKEKYPVLLDPAFMPQHSLLFEYVSRQEPFRIVLRYEEDDLVLLSGRDHRDLSMLEWDELEALSREHNLRLVDLVEVPSELDALLASVRSSSGVEGVVLRVPDRSGKPDQVYMKVKSASYVLLHRMRTELSARGVRDVCEASNVDSVEEFKELVVGQGGDWELLSSTRPLVEAYLDSQAATRARLDQLKTEIAGVRAGLTGDHRAQRKQFSIGYAASLNDPAERAVAFLLYNGMEREAFEHLRERRLNRDFASLISAERIAVRDADVDD